MAYADGTKSGGRTKGTPNRASRTLRTFLDSVFSEALADPDYRTTLVNSIKHGTISDKVLIRLLEYWAGAPTKQHEVRGTVSLASIIAGTASDDELEADE